MKLSPHAAEFSPINKNASIRSALNESWQTPTKVKKTKGERSKPRKRRRPKKSISILKDSPPTTSDASDAYHNLIPGEAMPHLTSESLGGQEKLKDCIIPGNDDVWTEDIARRMWSDWAIFAAEVERKRRIQLWEAMEEEQLQEREAMGKLAISLMETERSQRMTQHFAIDTANSNWFNAMFLSLESAGSMSLMDYEIKCPYHYRGCEASCRRSTLSHHLKYDCHCAAEVYHGDRVVSHSTEVNCDDMGSNYEVICPNSCLGCKHICQFGDIYDHLCTCEFSGYVSSEQQELERRYREQSVISQCEVERNRRVKADRFRSRHKCRSPVRNMLRCEDGDVRSGEGMEAGNDPIYTPSNEHLMSLHMLLVLQREILLSSLYKQVIERFTNREYVFSTYMQPNIDRVVDKVKDVIEGGITSWFACSEEGSVGKCRVESYGSYATGPHCIPSNLYQEAFLHWRGISIPMNESVGECDDSFDVDLVVCPDDFGYEYLFGGSGTSSTVSALIERLAEFLGGNSELVGIKVKSVVPHAHIPVIKVTAEYNVPELSNICFASGGRFQFCIDITLQSPHHLGVAAREMLTCLSASLSPFLPVAYIMKEYFKRLGLCGDAFQGGLPSYGLMIMTLLPVLQYLNRCNDFSGEGEPCSTGAKAEQGGEFKFPGMDSVSLLGDSAILDNMLPSTTCVAGLPSLSEGMFAPDCLNVDESPNVGIRRRSYSTPMPVTEANKSCQLTSGRGRYATINRCRLHGRRVALQLLGLERSDSQCNVGDEIPVLLPEVVPQVPLADPASSGAAPLRTYGNIIADLLAMYSNMELGKHGFSPRHGGFRFDTTSTASVTSDSVWANSPHTPTRIGSSPASPQRKRKHSKRSISIGCFEDRCIREVTDGRYVEVVIAHPQAHDPMIIEDPIDGMNNITKNCYKVHLIQRAINDAHEKLNYVYVRRRQNHDCISVEDELHPERSKLAPGPGICYPGQCNACLLFEIFGLCCVDW